MAPAPRQELLDRVAVQPTGSPSVHTSDSPRSSRAAASASGLGAIRVAAGRAQLRMRLVRAVAALPTATVLALVVAAVTLTARKLWPERLSDPTAWALLIGAGLSVVLAVAFALGRR